MSGFGSITEYFRGGRGGGGGGRGGGGGGGRGGGGGGRGGGGGGRGGGGGGRGGGPRGGGPRGGGGRGPRGGRRDTHIISGTPHYARYRPFGGYGALPYYGYYPDYLWTDDSTPQPIEPNWLGKRLVRIGQSATPEEIAAGVVVLEVNIPQPYVIIGPGQGAPGGSDPTRLQVYINANNIITSVVYA